jgi:hypothetical protein
MASSPNAPRRRAHGVRVIASLLLIAGYADLVHGGVTIAPLLLVAGYIVLLPLSLLVD